MSRVNWKEWLVNKREKCLIEFYINLNLIKITHWQSRCTKTLITYEMISPSFPNIENSQKWKEAFKACSSQRLFLPVSVSVLTN